MKILNLILMAFMVAMISACSNQPVKVACVGDSITEGPGRAHPESYPNQLQKALGKDYLVKNFGVSGRTLLKKGDFPYWAEEQFEEAKEFAPGILVIKLGTNDSKPQNWEFKEDFIADYVEMIESFQNQMPKKSKVFVCIPVPVTQDNFGIKEKVLVEEMRPMLLEIAKQAGAEIIDLYTPLEKRPELLPDGVHPNPAGLKIMAETIANYIR